MNIATPREVEYPPNTLYARKKLKLQLTKRQVQILVGSVLGDGYISCRGQIQLEHSDKYRRYLLWKFKELENISYKKVSSVRRSDKRNGKIYQSCRFWTRQYFRPWREYFYRGKKKIFPDKLRITPLILAIWYMDDGCFSDKRCTIAIENFPQSSCKKIQEVFGKQFGLDTYIRSNGKLAIRSCNHVKFFSLIKPFIHPSMSYKVL